MLLLYLSSLPFQRQSLSKLGEGGGAAEVEAKYGLMVQEEERDGMMDNSSMVIHDIYPYV